MEGSIRCLDCKPKPRLLADCRCRGETRRELRVYAGKDPITRRPIQRSKTVRAGKREAQAELATFINEILDERGASAIGSTSSLADLMQRWLRHVEDKDRGKGTLKNYRHHTAAVDRTLLDVLAQADTEAVEAAFERAGVDDPIARRPLPHQRHKFVRLFFDDQTKAKRRTWAHGEFVLGNVKLDRLIDEHIEAYYDALAWSGRSARTINGYHASIRAALNLGMQKKWIGGNPAIGTARPPIRDPELVVPSPAQVIHLVDVASGRAPEWGSFLRVAAGTWARRGEIVALRRSNVNLATREVTIAASMSSQQGLKDTKTHATRRLRIDVDTLKAITEQLERIGERARDAGVELADDPFLFSDDADAGRPWHPDTPSRFFEDVRTRAGIVGVRLHDFRHFGATQAISAGMPITSVSKRLGHSKVTTTLNVYAHWLPADDDDLADLMGELLATKAALRVVV